MEKYFKYEKNSLTTDTFISKENNNNQIIFIDLALKNFSLI